MRVVILTRQIGHYHDAKFTAAADKIDDFTALSITGEGKFKEFAVKPSGAYAVSRLYADEAEYDAARGAGAVADDIHARLNELNPDVVVIAGWAGAESFSAIDWARRKKRPIVMLSDSQAKDAARSGAREFIKRRVVSHADAGLVAGETHAAYLTDLGLPRDAIYLGYDVVGNDVYDEGADAARAQDKQKRAEFGLPNRYIFASARFIPKKNLLRLIEAYGEARLNVADAPDLVIIGDGEMRPEIEAMIEAADLAQCVHLHGFKSYKDLPAYYGLSEGFALVSLTEQWGLVVNEAMAAGLPLIVSKNCGVVNILEPGKNGWIIEPTETAEIAKAMTELFQMSAEDRQALGQRNRDTIADWGPERYADSLAKAIETAHARFRRKPFMLWDKALLKFLSKRSFTDVS